MVCNRRDGVVAWQDTCPDSTKLMRNDILFPRCIRLAVSTSSRGSTSRMHTDSGLSSQTSWKQHPRSERWSGTPNQTAFAGVRLAAVRIRFTESTSDAVSHDNNCPDSVHLARSQPERLRFARSIESPRQRLDQRIWRAWNSGASNHSRSWVSTSDSPGSLSRPLYCRPPSPDSVSLRHLH